MKKWLAPAAIVLAAVFIGGLTLALKPEPVATLEGYPITADELAFQMSRLKAGVQNEIETGYGVRLSHEDWSRPLEDGKTPIGELRDKALEEIMRDKTVFILAKERHLIDYVDYEDMLEAMEKENRRRQQAAAGGETVYGLVRFSPEPYYSHVLSSLKTALKTALSQGEGDPLYVERGEVEAYFREHQSDWTERATRYEVSKLTVPASTQNRDAVHAEVNRLLERGASFETIRSRFADAEIAEEVLTGKLGSANLNSSDYELLTKLKGSADGQVAATVETRQGLTVYRLDETVFDERKALQEYRYQITQRLLDERLNAYLANYRKALETNVNRDRLEAASL